MSLPTKTIANIKVIGIMSILKAVNEKTIAECINRYLLNFLL